LFVIKQRLCGESPSLTLPRTREREQNLLPLPHGERVGERGTFKKAKGLPAKHFGV
jgi:hypothetical protein